MSLIPWRIGGTGFASDFDRRVAPGGRPMGRLLDELWDSFELAQPSLVADPAVQFVPRLDVVETADEYRISAELPGLEEKDFQLVIEDGVLTLSGEKRSTTSSEDARVRRSETSYGRFERRLRFGVPIDEAKLSATYKHGVLTVVVPKAETAKPRTVHVQVTST